MKQPSQHIHISAKLQVRLAWLLFGALTLGYTLWIGYLSVLRYDTFVATAFDLGNLDQVVWNTLHGHLFQWTNQSDNYFGPPIRLAQHVEPIILPLSLLYLFAPDPRTLLIFQTFALASGALPVFLLARRYLEPWPLVAPALVAAYLFSPNLLGMNLYDFHPVSIATPLILYAFLALVKRRYGWFLLACLLAMACKEDVPFTMALFGVLLIWKYRLPRLGGVLIVIGLLWFSLAFFVVMPHFSGSKNNNFWYRYAALGATPLAALKNVALHPWLLFTYFINLDRVHYLFGLFRSTGFLALLAPEWLLPILLSLAINLLSQDSSLYSGIYQYNATIIPFILMATLHGLQRVLIWWQQWRGEPVTVPAVGALDPERPGTSSRSGSPQFLQNLLQRGSTLAQGFGVRAGSVVRPRLEPLVESGRGHWQNFSENMAGLARLVPLRRAQWYVGLWLVAMVALNWMIMTPLLNIVWPTGSVTDRERHIQLLLTEIPADAAVSAGTNMNPHVSERRYVTVFPSLTVSLLGQRTTKLVDYVIVDLQAVFPEDRNTTTVMLTQIMQSGQFCNLRQAEGVILLKRCSP